MVFNICARLFRFIRSIFVPAGLVFSFSILLTFFFILYKPGIGPGDLQRVGWQAWDAVSSVPLSSGMGGGSGVDWWNVTTSQDAADSASLPLDVWAPLLQHDTGLTDITIERCVWTSAMFDLCTPRSSKEDDAVKGKWVRVDRDLNLQAGMWHLFIYYRRTRRIDVPLVTNIQLLDATSPEPAPSTPSSTWHKVTLSVRDGIVRAPPLYLWYETDKPMRDVTPDEKKALITELDLLFGDNVPWFGFERASGPPTMEASSDRAPVYLTYRRGTKPVPRAPPLHFSVDGHFKIMQVADLHFSVGPGACRDPAEPCDGGAYARTSSLLARMLDLEKPDMVVFTGDQLNGQGTVIDAQSVLAKFAQEVARRGIPWAAVFGNHDDEDARGAGTRRDQAKLMQGLPYSLMQPGPDDIHGVGNYVLKVHSADPSKMHLLTLYFLDSGAYEQSVYTWFGLIRSAEYDWIHANQIDWFLQESASIPPIERPFTPDGVKDFGDIWRRQGEGQVAPSSVKLAKPNAMMFFHIPLPEAYGPADFDPRSGRALDQGVSGLEGKGSAKKNDGMLEKGLLRALESDHRGSRAPPEVKIVANGHCHITENCRRIQGVWMCFGGGGSYEGYGKVGFDRRFRIYDVSDYGETIRTYKRLENDDVVDEMTLAGKGAPEMSW
ncbi:Metallo-dependent phosphatase [Vararia minispora EC-137]|uniref:Metallo-dependent phosphatase n=1 Tax=Vararia minispora EC-137 TaxID=1314806 RepID=A0ACB8QB27_9AGAM|nr:Metallo-dependent phosphatase [Vararia minispora EC-137]